MLVSWCSLFGEHSRYSTSLPCHLSAMFGTPHSLLLTHLLVMLIHIRSCAAASLQWFCIDAILSKTGSLVCRASCSKWLCLWLCSLLLKPGLWEDGRTTRKDERQAGIDSFPRLSRNYFSQQTKRASLWSWWSHEASYAMKQVCIFLLFFFFAKDYYILV